MQVKNQHALHSNCQYMHIELQLVTILWVYKYVPFYVTQASIRDKAFAMKGSNNNRINLSKYRFY